MAGCAVLVAALGLALSVLVASPAGAVPVLSAHHDKRGLPGAQSSGLTFAQAPVALQAAVRRTLDVPDAAAASAWSQQAELTASDAASRDFFGISVAISGSTAVVGADDKNSTGGENQGSGAAYVFTQSGTTWSEQAELTDPGGTAGDGDYFGYSVAISGSTVVVGAWGSGAAYVFTQSGTSWSQQAELTAPGGADRGDHLGYSVAISGSTVVVGAMGTGSSAGPVYVYTQSGTTWSEQAELTGGAAGGGFGQPVAISGSTVMVSSDTGVDVFTRSGTTWSEQAELTDPGGSESDDGFGNSIAIAGSTAVIGAWGAGSFTGAAYVYTLSGSTWSEQAELTASDGAAQDYFGKSVAISGSTVVVGASGNESTTGTAYVYTLSGTKWSQQAELTASDGGGGDNFGFSVAISGSTTMVGGPYHGSTAPGAVYVFSARSSVVAQLGDSIASGEGTLYGYTYDAGTRRWSEPATPDPVWTGDFPDCHDSPAAYGNIVAKDLGDTAPLYQFGCTGASYLNGITEPETDVAPNGTSFQDRPAELGPPGGPYNTALTAADPNVVLVTFGADDVQFVKIVLSCAITNNTNPGLEGPVVHTGCLPCPAGGGRSRCVPGGEVYQQDFVDELPALNTYYGKVVDAIEDALAPGPPPVIVFTDYMNPFPAQGTTCPDTAFLSTGQINFLSSALNTLDNDIESDVKALEATHPNVGFADIRNTLAGHTWCSSDPWDYGLSIDTTASAFWNLFLYKLTDGREGQPLSPAPFHPTPAGQQAIAEIVLAKAQELAANASSG